MRGGESAKLEAGVIMFWKLRSSGTTKTRMTTTIATIDGGQIPTNTSTTGRKSSYESNTAQKSHRNQHTRDAGEDECKEPLPSSVVIPLLHTWLRPPWMLRRHRVLRSGSSTSVMSSSVVRTRRCARAGTIPGLTSGLTSGLWLPVHVPTGIRRVGVVR